MNSLEHSLKAIVLATLFVASSVVAQPTAERPAVNVGDTWEYQIKKRTDQSNSGRGNRRVVEISEDRIKVVRNLKTGENPATYDRSWNDIDKCHPDCFRPTLQFPMRLGNKWAFERKTPDNGGSQIGVYEVVKYETLTVPAGTFDCFRVDGEYKALRSHVLHTYWYCPKINGIAKQNVERRIAGQYAPGQLDLDEIELVRFTPGP
jgi:hypothetical protein